MGMYRRNAARQEKSRRRNNWITRGVASAAVLLVVAMLYVANLSDQRTLRYSRQDAEMLVDELWRDLEKGDNSYLPSLAQEKLQWCFARAANKNLYWNFVHPVPGEGRSSGSVSEVALLAMANCADDGRPVVVINMLPLMFMTRVTFGVEHGYDRKTRNTVALAIVHEAVHFEAPKEVTGSTDRATKLSEDR